MPPSRLSREYMRPGSLGVVPAGKDPVRLRTREDWGFLLCALLVRFSLPSSPISNLSLLYLSRCKWFHQEFPSVLVDLAMKFLCELVFLSVARGALTASTAQANPYYTLLASPLSNATVNATGSKYVPLFNASRSTYGHDTGSSGLETFRTLH